MFRGRRFGRLTRPTWLLTVIHVTVNLGASHLWRRLSQQIANQFCSFGVRFDACAQRLRHVPAGFSLVRCCWAQAVTAAQLRCSALKVAVCLPASFSSR
jgi:hypothetical protein